MIKGKLRLDPLGGVTSSDQFMLLCPQWAQVDGPVGQKAGAQTRAFHTQLFGASYMIDHHGICE